ARQRARLSRSQLAGADRDQRLVEEAEGRDRRRVHEDGGGERGEGRTPGLAEGAGRQEEERLSGSARARPPDRASPTRPPRLAQKARARRDRRPTSSSARPNRSATRARRPRTTSDRPPSAG